MRSHFSRFKEGVQISGVNLNLHQKGRVIYVCNSTVPAPQYGVGSDSNNGYNSDKPLATIKQAIANAIASRGDIIVILPGHAETLADATGFALNKAGLRVIGTGDGALKPTFTMSAAGSQIPITAANCAVLGVRVLASASSVTAAVSVAAANCELDIETIDTDATHAMVTGLITTASCSNLKAKLYHQGFAASSVGIRYVDLVGVVDADLDIDYFGNSSTAVVDMRTTACADIRVRGRFYNDAGSLTKNVTDHATSTWSVDGFDARAGQMFSGSTNQTVSYFNNLPVGISAVQVSAIKVIPQSTTTTVFTVAGGPVLLEYLAAEVTTVVQTQACNLKFTSTDTASSTATDICANLNISAAAVGTYLWVKMDALATALQSSAGGTGLGPTITTGIVIPPGTVAATTSASNTGNIKYHLRYKPLDPNATVTMS